MPRLIHPLTVSAVPGTQGWDLLLYSFGFTTSAATMKYLKKSLTIIMPIVVLGETLSWQIALGTLLIITGAIVVHKKSGNRL